MAQRDGSCGPSRQAGTVSWSAATRDGRTVPVEMSPRRLFGNHEGIRVSLVQDNGTGQTTFVVEQMDGVQSTMFARLGLDRYIIK